MLSVAAMGKAGEGPADYYENLAREDYYENGGEPPGVWGGQLAESMGLAGQVQKGQLRAMLEGFHPGTGEALARNAGEAHKAGWDMTYSAPKSVSVIWALADEKTRQAIQEAQLRAVNAGRSYLEQNAFTSRDRGARNEKITAVLAASFEHGTSREQDPQLHTHDLIANIGTRADGTVCALDFDTRHKMAAGAIYRSELAAQMQALGFQVERDKDSFRIAGIDDQVCKEFSKRRQQITSAMAEKGMKSAKAAAIAALDTRQDKGEVSRKELFAGWQEAGRGLGLDAAKIRDLQAGPQQGWAAMPSHKELLENLTQQASTFTPMQLQRAIATEAQGRLDAEGIKTYTNELLKSRELVKLAAETQRLDTRAGNEELRFTTREVLELESGIVQKSQARNTETFHQVNPEAAIAAHETMSEQQQAALRHITQQTGGVAVIEGMAGTGKSFLMGAARESWEAAGFNVRGCALAGKAAQGLEQGSGIKSQTLHSLLTALDGGNTTLTRQDVVVLDEAGMVGSRQMGALLDHAHKAGAKVVLIGDSQQLQPIDAGGSFRILSERLGHASLTEIRRQENESDRAIVRQFAAGQAGEALAALNERGLLKIDTTKQSAMEHMIAEWAAHRDPGRPGESLMLAGTRAEVFRLNQLARERMHQEHRLAVNTTLETAAGTREFAEGDRLLFTKNSRQLDVKNGTLGTIKRIELDRQGNYQITVLTDDNNTVKFTAGDPAEIKGAYNSIEHGYAVSVHKAQGVTVDNAYVLLNESMSDREWSYVAASRSRQETRLYGTEAMEDELEDIMSRSRQKDTALDYTIQEEAREPENSDFGAIEAVTEAVSEIEMEME